MTFADPIAWEETLPVRPSSPAWRAAVRAFYGSPLDEADAALVDELTGGAGAPAGSLEALFVVGRRGGKSETTARIAVFEALHVPHAVALAPGQIGVLPIIAPLREQAEQIIGYVRGLASLPAIKRRVAGMTATEVAFTTQVSIKIMTADSVALSGMTAVGAVLDEAAKLPGEESTMPDKEIIASLRPALAPVRGAPPRRLLAITSAFLDDGYAYKTEKEHFGKPGSPVFCVRGTTEQFNPNIDRGWLEKERRRVGERHFAREYLGDWQSSLTEGWFGEAAVLAAVDKGRPRSLRTPGAEHVVAIDAAFKGDRFALAVAHRERREGKPPVVVVDMVHAYESPRGTTLSVEDTVGAVAKLAKDYGTRIVYADQFGAQPLAVVFARHGISMRERPWTAQSKPARYRQVRDAMADGLVRLTDDPATTREFMNIQGRLLRSGGEQIEARRGHDDRVSAVVLAGSEAMTREVARFEPEIFRGVILSRRDLGDPRDQGPGPQDVLAWPDGSRTTWR